MILHGNLSILGIPYQRDEIIHYLCGIDRIGSATNMNQRLAGNDNISSFIQGYILGIKGLFRLEFKD